MKRRTAHLALAATCTVAAVLFVAASGPRAEDVGTAVLSGDVVDGPTGTPMGGVLVRVGPAQTVTEPDGSYSLIMASGPQIMEVTAWLPDGSVERLHDQRLSALPGSILNRHVVLVTEAYLDDYLPSDYAMGVPVFFERPAQESHPIDLLELWWSRLPPDQRPPHDALQRLTLPDVLPETIRVGRRWDPDGYTCSDTITEVTEVDFDEYAAGTVTAEIGVFRALETGEDSQLENFKLFAIAARSYALYRWASDPDAAYHIDDTACNQRWTEPPYPEVIARANEETAGMYLVQAGTTATIDAYEYAASCGHCGTLPEYQKDIVDDEPGGDPGCTTGGWCGHDDCAGHTDNPDCPLEGDGVRCLVRGICQWGSAERSANGDTWQEMLDHYQPNLDVIGGEVTLPTRLLGFVRAGDIDEGEDAVGALVSLDSGETATSGSNGLFVIELDSTGTLQMTVQADGFETFADEVDVIEGTDNWASVALTPIGGAEPADEPVESDVDEPDVGIDVGEDTAVEADAIAEGDDDHQDVAPEDAEQSPPPRFARVGPEGLGESACNQSSANGATAVQATIVLWLCLAAAARRRRS